MYAIIRCEDGTYYKSYKSASLYNTKFSFIDDIDYEKAKDVFF